MITCILLIAVALPAVARDVPVRTAGELQAALGSAAAGDRLLLAGGEYGALALWPKGGIDPRFDGPVTIQSRDPADPAVFTELRLTNARNIIFRQVVFDYRAAPGGYKERPFRITQSSDIAIEGSVFDGDNAHGAGPRSDGYGAGFGLNVRKSRRVRIENNVFRNFYRGMTMGEGVDNVVRGNEFTGMRSDGMNFVKATNLLIENNLVHGFRRNLAAGDHADMIQFWSKNAKTPTTGVTIRGNVFNMGAGDHTQTIFMRNEAVDSQGGGDAMFYRDIVIENNVIINGHLHGITVGETDGLTIRNNTLIRVPRRGEATRGPRKWMPQIRVAEASRNVTLADNVAPAIRTGRNGWTVRGNLAIQDVAGSKRDHYTHVFVNGLAGAPFALENYRARPGGLADRPGLGAPLLAQD